MNLNNNIIWTYLTQDLHDILDYRTVVEVGDGCFGCSPCGAIVMVQALLNGYYAQKGELT